MAKRKRGRPMDPIKIGKTHHVIATVAGGRALLGKIEHYMDVPVIPDGSLNPYGGILADGSAGLTPALRRALPIVDEYGPLTPLDTPDTHGESNG